MEGLRNLTISTTLTCNETCEHCWVSAGPKRSEDITSAEICSVLAQAAALGAEHVKFTGGEPLSRSDLPGLVECAHEIGLRVSIETNGLLLSDRLLGSLSRRGASPHFYVSVDGAKPRTHDKFRMKPGAFETTIDNLRRVREHDFYFSVHTVVRRSMVGEVPAIHELAVALGASQHKLILTMQSLGRGKAVSARSQLAAEEIFELLDRLPRQEFWDYGWDPAADRKTRLMTTLPPAFQPAGAKATTCGWSRSFLSVLADGSVALCHGLYDVEEAVAGNIRDQSLEEIWLRSDLFSVTRAWSGEDLSGVCGNCRLRDECRGLCRANAIGHFGDLKAPYPLCQTLYDAGQFPEEMLVDPGLDNRYPVPA